MSEIKINAALNRLFKAAPTIKITRKERFVIFSDLHLGNGSSRDDFLPNSYFFKNILDNYYFKNDYQLILNGDIEELQRFSLREINLRWKELYQIFEKFNAKNAFFQITGNHDHELYKNIVYNPSFATK